MVGRVGRGRPNASREFLTASKVPKKTRLPNSFPHSDSTRLGIGRLARSTKSGLSDACSVKSSANDGNEKPRNRLIRFVWPLQRGATSQPRSVEGLSL